jgi:hypothetical protein
MFNPIRTMFDDRAAHPRLCADDVEALLEIDATLRAPSPEWVDFMGEALSHWLVEQRAPAGIVDEAKADWLIRHIDGARPSPAALAVLRRCCIRAGQVPAALLHYLRRAESMA